MKRAFTLMELLVAILIIFLLMGLLIVAIRQVRGSAKGSVDRVTVTSLKSGITQFNSEFHFLPPLVKDFDPSGPLQTVSGRKIPLVYSVSNPADATKLRTAPPPVVPRDAPRVIYDMRFSQLSIPYYLIGALEVAGTASSTAPIDGVAGLGFLTPKQDGTFEKSGRKFDPFFDVGGKSKALFSSDAAAGRVVLRDANGVPFRYYRWLRGRPSVPGNPIINVDDCNAPPLAGDPLEDVQLRGADYAIIGAGPDGVFGDEGDIFDVATEPLEKAQGMPWSDLANKVGLSDPLGDPVLRERVRRAARKDNIVEVGAK